MRSVPPGCAGLLLTGITHDSRDVRPGDLYAALPGARTHGADFAAAAARAGAVAILTDRSGEPAATATGLPVLVVPQPRDVLGALAAWVYGNPGAGLLLVGVTGTNGKTTTAYLVEAGLRAVGHRTGLVGTIETRIAGQAIASVRTTPESTDLHALLAVMRERGVTAAAIEVSSHALAFGRVDGVVYDVAIFTNLSQDHLDFHADMEDYFAAKRSLFTPERARSGVVNIDDSYGRRIASDAAIPIVTVSPSGAVPANWTARDIHLGPADTSFTAVRDPARMAGRTPADDGVTSPEVGTTASETHVHVRLPGRYNIENTLLALAGLVTEGVPAEVAAAGISSCAGVPGRLERVDVGQPFRAVVDYAHTPDAVASVLRTLREITKGKVIAVLGCGGDRDRLKRPMMGKVGARGADLLVVTDDNPRSEDPASIRAAMLDGAGSVPTAERGNVIEIGDRRAAIEYGVGRAGAHDTVVVLGKGHEQGQEIGDATAQFDDRAVLRECLRERMDGDRG